MRLPCGLWTPEDFRWSAYRSMFGTAPTHLTGWEACVDFHAETMSAPFEKGEGPAYAGFVGPGRQTNDVTHVTSFNIDVDTGPDVHRALFRLRNDLLNQDISYLMQYRTTATGQQKAHIIIPFSTPFQVHDAASVARTRLMLTQALADQYRFEPDKSITRVNSIVFAYASRRGQPKPNQDANIGAYALDFHAVPAPIVVPVNRSLKSSAEQERELNALQKALQHDGLFGDWLESKGAWEIVCPHQHGPTGKRKTLLYPTGHISCMAGKCAFKPVSWFISCLSPGAQEIAAEGGSARLRTSLTRATTEKISLKEAESALHKTLSSVSAVNRKAQVVRVTTGAGKTRAVARHLNEYSAPTEDGYGKTAVLATPTNALLREVEERIQVPHVRRMGVLAVLNDDDTPACKKFGAASALQAAGGNVHRLMCSHCEYKDACPARALAKVGEGSLTITNHSLMATVADELHEGGRHPLVVWDESPAMVQTSSITKADLVWLLEAFVDEADVAREPDPFTRMVSTRLFTPKYRSAIRPMVELLKVIAESESPNINLEHLADVWANVPYRESLLARALATVDIEPVKPRYPGAAWTDIAAAFRAAARVNPTDLGFDLMPESQQQRVLRAERIVTSLGVMGGDGARCIIAPTGLQMASLTPNGALWRDYGGVVLDATANIPELKALRPDAGVVNLAVEDAGAVERSAIYSGSLSRTALAQSTSAFMAAIKRVQARCRIFEKQHKRPPKTVAFTYKAQIELGQRLAPEIDWHHYGDTRGYDHWFQEGYEVYATIGDPVTNLTALALTWMVVNNTKDVEENEAWWGYVAGSAEAELAQAHGRARDPQQSKSESGETIHMHFGRNTPAGWDLTNAGVDVALVGGSD